MLSEDASSGNTSGNSSPSRLDIMSWIILSCSFRGPYTRDSRSPDSWSESVIVPIGFEGRQSRSFSYPQWKQEVILRVLNPQLHGSLLRTAGPILWIYVHRFDWMILSKKTKRHENVLQNMLCDDNTSMIDEHLVMYFQYCKCISIILLCHLYYLMFSFSCYLFLDLP